MLWCCCPPNAVILCIYDESSPYDPVDGGSEETLAEDRELYIDAYRRARRVGIVPAVVMLVPTSGFVPVGGLPREQRWFAQVQLDPIFRYHAEDVAGAFLVAFGPRRLRGDVPARLAFCLDNSGSITSAGYAAERAEGVATITEQYPQLLASETTDGSERWVRTAAIELENLIEERGQ